MTDETRLPGYDAVIPARVRYDQELTDKAKLLYGEIRALASRDGYCWATNAYFCHLYMVSESTIQRNIAALTDRGHIWSEVIRDEETNAVLERRLWVDRARFLTRDPDEPPGNFAGSPPKNDTTPPRKNEGTPPRKNDGENITRENSTREEDPPVVPPKGGRRKGKGPRKEPDWKPDRFKGFWDYYPRGENKQKAMDAWDKLQPDDELIDRIAKALKVLKRTRDWQEGVGIPHASTFLNQARWEDANRLTAQGEAAPEAPAEPYTGGLDEAQRQALLYGGD